MDNKELQSFYDGYSLHSYEIFGAHFENGGVVFRLFAPNAKSVRLIGDFNGWNDSQTFLNKINKEVWETFVPGLSDYARYKYVIEQQDGKLVAKNDPYAFYNELRPDWCCKVVSLDQYKWTDDAWLKQRTNCLDKPVNMYEVHLGGYKHNAEGKWLTYYEMINELVPYVKEMGYTHIELMPLNEFPFDGSWGYQQYGYFSITSRYGSPYQLMMFIDACHKAGLGVIMDVVLAHFVKDDFGLAYFDGSHLFESSNPADAESQWDTYYFDFSKNHVVSFLMSSVSMWINKYHIDGIRVDAVSNLVYWGGDSRRGENQPAVSFLKRLNYYLHINYPGIMVIAEDSTAYPNVTKPVEFGGLGFDYKWDLGWMNDTLKYYKMDPEFRKYHHNLINFSMAYFYSENFLLPLSHDEVVHMKGSVLNKMWGNYEQKFAQCRNLMVYMYTHPGKKLNFMGNEIATFREFIEERELDWSVLRYPMHDSYRRLIRDLNTIYKAHDAFWAQDYKLEGYKWIDADNNNDRVYSYMRFGKDKFYVVVLNMAPVSHEQFELGVPAEGEYVEMLNSEKDIYSGCNMCNFTPVKATKGEKNGFPNKISIRLAPFAGVIFEAQLPKK